MYIFVVCYNNFSFTSSSLPSLGPSIPDVVRNARLSLPPTNRESARDNPNIRGTTVTRISTTMTRAGSRLNRGRRIRRLLIEKRDENDDDDVDPESSRYSYSRMRRNYANGVRRKTIKRIPPITCVYRYQLVLIPSSSLQRFTRYTGKISNGTNSE